MTKKESPLNKAVAAQLRAEKAINGATLDQLVERTGFAKSAISNYLAGSRPISVDTLDLLASALGTSAPEILIAAAERLNK